MFSPQELQLILSGDRGRIDVQDLRRNVVYHGGYADSQPYIQEVSRHALPLHYHVLRPPKIDAITHLTRYQAVYST